jgi:hypothetical protein
MRRYWGSISQSFHHFFVGTPISAQHLFKYAQKHIQKCWKVDPEMVEKISKYEGKCIVTSISA